MIGKPFTDPGWLGFDDPRLVPAVEAIGNAVKGVIQEIATLGLPAEEPVTERLAQAIRAQIGAAPQAQGVGWQAAIRSRRSRGPDLAVVASLELGDYAGERLFVAAFERVERVGAGRERLRTRAQQLLAITPAAVIAVIDPAAGIFAVPAGDHASPTFPARERAAPLEHVFGACFAGAFGDPSQPVLTRVRGRQTVTLTAKTVW